MNEDEEEVDDESDQASSAASAFSSSSSTSASSSISSSASIMHELDEDQLAAYFDDWSSYQYDCVAEQKTDEAALTFSTFEQPLTGNMKNAIIYRVGMDIKYANIQFAYQFKFLNVDLDDSSGQRHVLMHALEVVNQIELQLASQFRNSTIEVSPSSSSSATDNSCFVCQSKLENFNKSSATVIGFRDLKPCRQCDQSSHQQRFESILETPSMIVESEYVVSRRDLMFKFTPNYFCLSSRFDL